MATVNTAQDIIDVKELTDRLDDLRSERDDLQTYIDEANAALDAANYESRADAISAIDSADNDLAEWEADNSEELEELESLIEKLQGMGGDHRWEGNWYPATLIHDSHFEDYAQELADDIGAVDSNASWPMNCIDWIKAARELQMDYTPVEIDSVAYWTR